MSYFILLLIFFISGVCYRLSEIERVWKNATWDYRWGKKLKIKIAPWVTDWMKGDNDPPINDLQRWALFWFHRFTFSFFENGYHFFRNFPFVVLFPAYFLSGFVTDHISLLQIWYLFLARWVGTDLTLRIITRVK